MTAHSYLVLRAAAVCPTATSALFPAGRLGAPMPGRNYCAELTPNPATWGDPALGTTAPLHIITQPFSLNSAKFRMTKGRAHLVFLWFFIFFFPELLFPPTPRISGWDWVTMPIEFFPYWRIHWNRDLFVTLQSILIELPLPPLWYHVCSLALSEHQTLGLMELFFSRSLQCKSVGVNRGESS